MKKSLLVVFAVVFASFLLQAQTTTRRVMIEQFTQASCGPCAAQNPGFNALLGNNLDKVTILKYQTSWPGYDPMNEQNPDQVQNRVDYYAVTGVPNVRIDGTTNAGTSGSVTQAMINTAYGIPSPISMTLTHSLSADLSQITINCDITNANPTIGWVVPDAYLRVALVEKEINFPTPPGSNGETDFSYVMRQMYPDAQGTSVAPIPGGGTASFSWTVDVPDYIYNYNEIAVVAFVQSQASKTVYQSTISEPQALPGDFPDAAFVTSTQGPAGLCDYDLTPSASITNEGGLTLTSFDVSYSINGGTPVVQNWTGSLASGATEVVNFPTIQVGAGETIVAYDLSNINGGLQDINILNNIVPTEAFYVIAEDPIGIEINSDMEADEPEGVPANAVAERAATWDMCVVDKPFLQSLGLTVNAEVGGFANSSKSVMVDFYLMLPGVTSALTYYKVDWSNNINDSLSFDVAYRQYSSENDRLEVLVSTDCGTTWESVYDKAGAQLKTANASTTFFVPTAAQWRTDYVDLSAYDGAEEVIVRFQCYSEYGNNLFLDNINIGGTFVSAVEDAIVDGNVNVFPNPASDVVNVNFTMAKANQVSVNVYDVTGKLVATLLDNQLLGAGDQKVQWSTANTGMYFVKIRTEEGEITRKLNVVK